MPEAGMNTLVKVEHEETVTMPRYLLQYGLQRCSFKIALDENLIQALKVLDKLHLNSIEPVQVKDTMVVPRDVIAACAPQPSEQTKMAGNMIVGVYAIGQKDGKEKKVMMYQKFSQEEAMQQFGLQAVVAQTGFGAAIAIELYARDIYHQAGVYSLEAFDPMPFFRADERNQFPFCCPNLNTRSSVFTDLFLRKMMIESHDPPDTDHCDQCTNADSYNLIGNQKTQTNRDRNI